MIWFYSIYKCSKLQHIIFFIIIYIFTANVEEKQLLSTNYSVNSIVHTRSWV